MREESGEEDELCVGSADATTLRRRGTRRIDASTTGQERAHKEFERPQEMTSREKKGNKDDKTGRSELQTTKTDETKRGVSSGVSENL